MPKFTLEEKVEVRALSKEGHSNTEIARRMSEKYPDNWGAKSAHRSVARILKGEDDPENQEIKTLDEMTREERYDHIDDKLTTTPRFKMTFKNFSIEEKEVFKNEYLRIVKSTDTLTEAEEQTLFAGILELVLAYQSLSRKEKLEKLRERTLDGEFQEGDPRFTRVVDDRYQKEYDQHMKLYLGFIKHMKMSREQRLKAVSTQKVSLIDIAEQLSSKTAQVEAAVEIEKLSNQRDEELQKLLDSGYLYGIFEGYE